MSGSNKPPETSLMIRAPAATAARATTAFVVSIETVTPAAASRSTTGSARRSSSSAVTGRARGFVASPPTSRISAPSRSSCSPCATATSASRYCPPSENESGVTLTTPITRTPLDKTPTSVTPDKATLGRFGRRVFLAQRREDRGTLALRVVLLRGGFLALLGRGRDRPVDAAAAQQGVDVRTVERLVLEQGFGDLVELLTMVGQDLHRPGVLL